MRSDVWWVRCERRLEQYLADRQAAREREEAELAGDVGPAYFGGLQAPVVEVEEEAEEAEGREEAEEAEVREVEGGEGKRPREGAEEDKPEQPEEKKQKSGGGQWL